MEPKRILDLPQPKGMPDWQWLDLKVQLLLISTGHKQAISMHMADDIPDASEALNILGKELERAGFIVDTESKSIHDHYRLYVGQDKASVELLKKALSGELPIQEANRIHGILSGFPQTAIDAFIQNKILSPDELSGDVRKSPAYVFGTFRFSRDHWQRELATAAEWAEAIHKISPELYQGFLDEFTQIRIK